MKRHKGKGEHNQDEEGQQEKKLPPAAETQMPPYLEGHIFHPEHGETQSPPQWPPIIAPFMEPPQREPPPDMPYNPPGADLVQWTGYLDACVMCRANIEAGAIPAGQPFPSGDTDAPAHDNCRCNVVRV